MVTTLTEATLDGVATTPWEEQEVKAAGGGNGYGFFIYCKLGYGVHALEKRQLNIYHP
jgi:hypothetical protein